MDKTELKTGAKIVDRDGVTGIVYIRMDPQGTPEPYWTVDHPNSGRTTAVLERRLLSSDYSLDTTE